jgi:hypothetical protein
MLAKTGLNEDWVENLAGQLGLSIAASLTEKSYFAGLEALAVLADPTQLMKGDTALKGLLQTGNNMVPLAGTRRAFANSLDPYMREYDNEFQRAAAAAIPGVSRSFPEKINVLTGKPLNNPNGGPWNALVPFETSPDNKDPVAKKEYHQKYHQKNKVHRNEMNKLWKKKNPQYMQNYKKKYAKQIKTYELNRKYGMKLETYEHLEKIQIYFLMKI